MVEYTTQLGFVAALVVLFVVYRNVYVPGTDASEPPAISPGIPLIGHLIRMRKYGVLHYYTRLRDEHNLPIYTLSILGSKIYIANALDLVVAAQRQYRQLDFAPVALKIAHRLGGWTNEAQSILTRNASGEQGDSGLFPNIHRVTKDGMAPGLNLDEIVKPMLERINGSLERIRPTETYKPKIHLLKWLRHELTIATTFAAYGPKNPFVDETVENGFWDLANNFDKILMNVFPAWTAPKGHQGRKIMNEALCKYISDGSYQTGSLSIRNRVQVNLDYGVSILDTAKIESMGSVAFLLNTLPASFWVMFDIFSRPDLLADIREELDGIMTLSEDEKGRKIRTLDARKLKSSCPLLNSTFQEVMRYRGSGSMVREVVEDTILGGYLLKKGALMQMPNRVVHTDPEVWGHDFDQFNPRRFMKSATGSKRAPAAAYRIFGAGQSLCPGRYFAQAEIVALVAMFAMRYEMRPSSGGEFVAPTSENTNVAAGVLEPDTDIELAIESRAGYENDSWQFKLEIAEQSQDVR